MGIASGLSVALGESFTITYHSEGGSEIAPATYQSGEESVEPVWPLRNGYDFAGWYTEKKLTNKFEFGKPVTQNYDLWAKWTERSVFFTVTFDTNGGFYVFPKRVQKGTFCLPPNPSPTKDGFIFIDWCVDKGLSQPWKFSIEPVVEDITVYAKWEDASMVKKTKVVFDLKGGDSTPIPEQEVPDHGRVAKPENPTKTGFDFVGWESVYKGLGMPFDIDTTLVYYDAYPDHILTLRALARGWD